MRNESLGEARGGALPPARGRARDEEGRDQDARAHAERHVDGRRQRRAQGVRAHRPDDEAEIPHQNWNQRQKEFLYDGPISDLKFHSFYNPDNDHGHDQESGLLLG